jgi:DNA-binding GntR family transcriptional regulator
VERFSKVVVPLETVSTVGALERALEDRILDGDLGPGAHLREAELSREYDVARHSLRAACDALVRRGLLVKRVNRGFFVPELTLEDAREIFQVRRAYELPVARDLAARGEVPPAMLAAMRTFEALADDDPSWHDLARIDVEFHRGLVAAAGNSRLERAHANLLSEVALCVAQIARSAEESASELAGQHRELLDAIESGDPDRAERELTAHFDEGLRRLRRG